MESELNELTSFYLHLVGMSMEVDQTAAYALLSRLYLNAPVYAGKDMYNEAASAQSAISGLIQLIQWCKW